MIDPAIAFLGDTQSGKSSLAKDEMLRAVQATALPLAVVDTTFAWNFRSMYHARTREEFRDVVFGARRHCAFTTQERDDADWICKAVRETVINLRMKGHDPAAVTRKAGCILVIDETSFFTRKGGAPDNMRKALATWAHFDGRIRFITQRGIHVPKEAWDANPVVRICRTTGRLNRQFYEEEFDVPFDLPATLRGTQHDPVKQYITVRDGKLERDAHGEPVIRSFTAPRRRT